ncbi:MAG TPA: hypothetical protein PLL57_02770 [Flavobacteriales bacterium]|nr:hypothetical protein [Flavobacteriales bacterium]
MLRFVRILLFIMGVVVLLGQLWPAGAPPFARSVNILFAVGVLLYLGRDLWWRK